MQDCLIFYRILKLNMYTVQHIHGEPLNYSDGHQAVEVCNESADGKLN